MIPADEDSPPSRPPAAAGVEPTELHGPPSARDPVPPHLAQFYPPFYAHSRPPGIGEGAMPTAMESFLPPPPPPAYASPQRWLYPPYLQTPSMGAEQSTPSRYYEERPPNPAPGPGFVPSTLGFPPVNPYNKLGFGASLDGQGFSQFRASDPGFGPMQSTQEAKDGVFSPSGVSMQVHPPSSPPIDPSTSIQPTTLSASHLGYVPTSTGSVGVAGLGASHVSQVDTMIGGGGAKVSGTGETKEEGTKDGEESMSSLPMSVPEGIR